MLGRHAEAKSALRRSVALLEDLSAEGRLTPDTRRQLADCYVTLANVLHLRDAQRAHAFQKAVRLSEELAREFPENARYRDRLAAVRLSLSTEIYRSRPEEARALCRLAIATAEGPGGDPAQLA